MNFPWEVNGHGIQTFVLCNFYPIAAVITEEETPPKSIECTENVLSFVTFCSEDLPKKKSRHGKFRNSSCKE